MPGASGGVTADTVAPGKSQAPHESRQDGLYLRSEDDREVRAKNEPSPPQSPQNPCKLPTADPTVWYFNPDVSGQHASKLLRKNVQSSITHGG